MCGEGERRRGGRALFLTDSEVEAEDESAFQLSAEWTM